MHFDHGPEPVQILAGSSADRDHGREFMPSGGLGEHGKQRLATLDPIDLVEGQDGRRRLGADPLENVIVVRRPARCLSTTMTTRSAPINALDATRFMYRLRARARPLWIPGVSTKTICDVPLVAIPRIRWRVVCGRLEVMLSFRPRILLTSVDLPTFGRPATVTKPQR